MSTTTDKEEKDVSTTNKSGGGGEDVTATVSPSTVEGGTLKRKKKAKKSASQSSPTASSSSVEGTATSSPDTAKEGKKEARRKASASAETATKKSGGAGNKSPKSTSNESTAEYKTKGESETTGATKTAPKTAENNSSSAAKLRSSTSPPSPHTDKKVEKQKSGGSSPRSSPTTPSASSSSASSSSATHHPRSYSVGTEPSMQPSDSGTDADMFFHQALHSGELEQVRLALKQLKRSRANSTASASSSSEGGGEKKRGMVGGVGVGMIGIRASGLNNTKRTLQSWIDTEEQMSALHVAVERNDLELVRFLVSKRANINDMNNKTKCTPLVLAASKGYLDVCKFLLGQKKVDVNLVNIDDTSALHYLVRHAPTTGHAFTLLSELIKMLIKRKADIDAQNFRGESPLHQATRVGNDLAILQLAQWGANMNAVNKNGETALHYAVLLGRHQIVRTLLYHGVDKNIRAKDGLTALDVAKKEHREEMAEIIANFCPDEKAVLQEKQRMEQLKRYEKMVTALAESPVIAKKLSTCVGKAEYNNLAKALLHISIPMGTTISLINSLLDVEFYKSDAEGDASILRGNCTVSKVMGGFSRKIGTEYLNSSLGLAVKSIVFDENICFELNPRKLEQEIVAQRKEDLMKNAKEGETVPEPTISETELEAIIDENKKALLTHATVLFNRIVSDDKIDAIPREIRAIAGLIAEYARERAPEQEYALVGGFLLLRFINPALVSPESYGMLPWGKVPSLSSRRNLIMITKLLQNLSNDVAFGVKEPYMQIVNCFIEDNREKMFGFLKKVITDTKKDSEDAVDWADCRNEKPQSIKDLTILDVNELQFLHRVLFKSKAAVKESILKDKSENLITEKEYEAALHLLKVVDGLGAPPQ
ncbi:PH domain-containing protein [Balamuthia mandrillaris]